MLATLGQRKLSVGFVKCKLYSWKSHGRCYRCQEVGHFVASCKANIACSKCSGDHYLKDCESDRNCCVYCVLHEKEDISHPLYSPDCPFNKYLWFSFLLLHMQRAKARLISSPYVPVLYILFYGLCITGREFLGAI